MAAHTSHGVPRALAAGLLTDGTGPIFCPHPDGYLRETAFRAAFHAEAG